MNFSLQLPTRIESVGDTGVLCNVGENNFFKINVLLWCAILMKKLFR